jgi:itaconyl-CoA hydratase
MAVHNSSTGYFFDDFSVGDVFRHPLGRTISEVDNMWFTLLTMNTNQLHFNSHYARHSPYGRELVNSGLTVAIVLGISVSDISQNALANLGWTDIMLKAPVVVGDTLYGESIITGLRDSKSRPYAGIVSCFTRGLNQNGIEVLTFNRSVMVYRASERSRAVIFPEPVHPIHPGTKSQDPN